MVDEPAQAPQAWIYQVDGEFAQDEDIPAECIVGAWPIDCEGRVCGQYIANPHYAPITQESAPEGDWTKI